MTGLSIISRGVGHCNSVRAAVAVAVIVVDFMYAASSILRRETEKTQDGGLPSGVSHIHTALENNADCAPVSVRPRTESSLRQC